MTGASLVAREARGSRCARPSVAIGAAATGVASWAGRAAHVLGQRERERVSEKILCEWTVFGIVGRLLLIHCQDVLILEENVALLRGYSQIQGDVRSLCRKRDEERHPYIILTSGLTTWPIFEGIRNPKPTDGLF